MIQPVKKPICTSGYGNRWLFGKWDFHPGTDLVSQSANRTVFAVWPGKVVTDFDVYNHALRWKDRRHSAGNFVCIESEWNDLVFWQRYLHLEHNTVSAMQEIKVGQPLGVYGNVGQATGAHLHFDLWDPVKKKFLDIRPFCDMLSIPHRKGDHRDE